MCKNYHVRQSVYDSFLNENCPFPCPQPCTPCPPPCYCEFCFTITKRDGTTGIPLANAEYTLFQSGTALGCVTSDATGRLRFNGLFPGIYELQETRAPDGYELDPVSHLVRISRNGSVTIDNIFLTDFRMNDTPIQKPPARSAETTIE